MSNIVDLDTDKETRLSFEEWNELLETGLVDDISDELPDSFLMVYQRMRAKILYKGQKFYVSGWQLPEDKEGYVSIIPENLGTIRL